MMKQHVTPSSGVDTVAGFAISPAITSADECCCRLSQSFFRRFTADMKSQSLPFPCELRKQTCALVARYISIKKNMLRWISRAR